MTVTNRGPYRNGQRTREQILDAALTAFGKTGFRGTSLRDIAAQVGSSPPTLLAHFGSKDGLLLAVLDAWSHRTLLLEPTRKPGLGWFAHYRNLMAYHVQNPGLLRLFVMMAAESADPAHPAHSWVAARYARLQNEGVENLTTAIRTGEARFMSAAEQDTEIRSLYAVMDGYSLRWLNDDSFDLVTEFNSVFHKILVSWRSSSR